ncbi:MAG TPA: metallophosphoesterase [Phycisphaerae bacterium]|nr:metallophosphoesterase [Phycisphaerae bacterium]
MAILFRPQIDVLDLPCERLPREFDGLGVLHLSDLHVTKWTKKLDVWREELAKLTPELVVITGDLGHRSWLWQRSLENVQRLLEPLRPPLGTFFILGNHDSAKLGPALAETRDPGGGRRVMLRNETVFVVCENSEFRIQNSEVNREAAGSEGRLALIGVHQHRRIDTDILSAMRPVRAGDFKMMLLHYPDLVHPAIAAGADVCLAGHTHGGQVCWPDGSPLFGQDTLSPAQCTGVHRINGTWMIVNRGIGAAGVKVRFFCPPQAVMFTLRAGRGATT